MSIYLRLRNSSILRNLLYPRSFLREKKLSEAKSWVPASLLKEFMLEPWSSSQSSDPKLSSSNPLALL